MMKCTVLLENITQNAALTAKHGLSLFVRRENDSFLFDFGPDDAYLKNAEELGIEVEKVAFAVLSHGHNDHGGGIAAFLERNTTSPVYLRRNAFGNCVGSTGCPIGLDPALKQSKQLFLTDEQCELDATAMLFSGVTERECVSPINSVLLRDGMPDLFSHEQSMLLQEGEKLILIGGCAHCGIVNILEKARRIAGRYPDIVLSGMHLSVSGIHSSEEFLEALARRLSGFPTMFYTFHCTGTDSYETLKQKMSGQLVYMSTGESLQV